MERNATVTNHPYLRLIDEQIENYNSTKNPETLKKGKETIKEYMSFRKSNPHLSTDPDVAMQFSGPFGLIQELEDLEEKMLSSFK